MKVRVILNGTARMLRSRRAGSVRREIVEQMSAEGASVEIREPVDAVEGEEIARRAAMDGVALVMAAGGDGTVHAVVNGLVGTEVQLGVLPLGTENVLAREMGIPLELRRACRFALTTQPRRVDVCRLGDRHFLCFAGIGLDAHVVAHVEPRLKGFLGGLAFFLTGLGLLWRYRDLVPHARLTMPDRTVETAFWIIVVGNIKSYGWQVRPASLAAVDDGLMDVCIFPRTTRLGVLGQLASVFLGRHLRLPEVRYFRTDRLTVTTVPPVRVQADGELAGHTPVELAVVPRALLARF